jgi:ABC-type multidrug transport system fused ATPase/permease subunit
MNWNKKVTLFIIVLFGLLVPFVPYLTVIEMFYLLVPFVIIFIVTLIYVFASLFNKNLNSKIAVFFFLIIPIFIISQLTSGFIVDKIQRLRSYKIISEIKKIKNETGRYPEKYDLILGIKYYKIKTKDSFVIEYSRGFMVTERYESENKTWSSSGWND